MDEPSDENELIKPAVDGTLAVMRAAQQHKVKKVVITSSCVAIFEGHPEKDRFTEADWSDVTKCGAYSKSKTLAEKAAWDFVAALPENEKFHVATVNPGLVVGPNYNTAKFTSGDIIKTLMTGQMSAVGLPRIALPLVDVRNVAQAHLEAAIRDEANGKRFILCEKALFFSELGDALKEKYGDKYPITTADMSRCFVGFMACFSG